MPDPKPIPAPTDEQLKDDLVWAHKHWDEEVHSVVAYAKRDFVVGLIRRCFAAERDRDAALERVRKLEAGGDCHCWVRNAGTDEPFKCLGCGKEQVDDQR